MANKKNPSQRRSLSSRIDAAIADNENLMRRLARYAKKLAKEQNDPTLMTKEEYFAMLDEAEEQMKRGEYTVMLPGEDLTTHLRRHGYDI